MPEIFNKFPLINFKVFRERFVKRNSSKGHVIKLFTEVTLKQKNRIIIGYIIMLRYLRPGVLISRGIQIISCFQRKFHFIKCREVLKKVEMCFHNFENNGVFKSRLDKMQTITQKKYLNSYQNNAQSVQLLISILKSIVANFLFQ